MAVSIFHQSGAEVHCLPIALSPQNLDGRKQPMVAQRSK
jgi:hypothetical protein